MGSTVLESMITDYQSLIEKTNRYEDEIKRLKELKSRYESHAQDTNTLNKSIEKLKIQNDELIRDNQHLYGKVKRQNNDIHDILEEKEAKQAKYEREIRKLRHYVSILQKIEVDQQDEIKELKKEANGAHILKVENQEMENELQGFINKVTAAGIITEEHIKQKNLTEQLGYVADAVINEIQKSKNSKPLNSTEYEFVTNIKEIEARLKTSEVNLESMIEKLRNSVEKTEIKKRYNTIRQLQNKYRKLKNVPIELGSKLQKYKEHKSNEKKIETQFRLLNEALEKVKRKTFDTNLNVSKILTEIQQFTEEQDTEMNKGVEFNLKIVNAEMTLYQEILDIIDQDKDLAPLKKIIANNEIKGVKRNYEELDKDLENSKNLSGISAHKKKR